jgi:hypothetical protein
MSSDRPPDRSWDLDALAGIRRSVEALTADRGIRHREALVVGVLRAAVQAVVGADGASLTRTGPRDPAPDHATDDEIAVLDAVQLKSGAGPCVDAADHAPERGLVLAADLAGDHDHERWPEFAERAVDAGYRSVLSLRIGVDPRHRSSLNLYARRHHAFGHEAQVAAVLFGVQAALLLHGADHADDLQHALESRDLIGQAKGILVERFGVDSERAFSMLVDSSQNTNMKLVDVARWLVDETLSKDQDAAPPGRS